MLLLGVLLAIACGGSVDLGGSVCQACTADPDCGAGAACAQLGGRTFCAPLCPTGNECAGGSTCTTLSSVSVDEVTACVPQGSCGASTDAGAGTDGAVSCSGLSAPSVSATCDACNRESKDCQPNGCYNGWFCLVATRDCQPPPTSCDGGTVDEAGKSD